MLEHAWFQLTGLLVTIGLALFGWIQIVGTAVGIDILQPVR